MADQSLSASVRAGKCIRCGSKAAPPGKRGKKPKYCVGCRASEQKLGQKRHWDKSKSDRTRVCRCGRCGSVFSTTFPDKRFCSDKCRRSAQDSKGINRTCECLGCGKAFRPLRHDRIGYCSRLCASHHVTRKPRAKAPPRPKRPIVCRGCAVELSNRKLRLCDPCRQKTIYVKKVPAFTQCADCGSSIPGACARCGPCSKKRGRKLAAAKHGRVKKHKERAARYGVPYEPINPIAVFERDGWTCKGCGRPTPKGFRGTLAASAPELDHIIPMSKGGGHLWANVQCLCRACNGAKGATVPAIAA